jgi:hypothetical protein
MLHGPLQVTQLHLEYSLESQGPVHFNIQMCLFSAKNLRSMSRLTHSFRYGYGKFKRKH